jgi:hypothetical protein
MTHNIIRIQLHHRTSNLHTLMEADIPRRAARRHLNSHFIQTKHGQVRAVLFPKPRYRRS